MYSEATRSHRQNSSSSLFLFLSTKRYSEIFSPCGKGGIKLLEFEEKYRNFEAGCWDTCERGEKKSLLSPRGHFFDPFGRRCLVVSPTLTSWFAAARAINYNPCPSLLLSLSLFPASPLSFFSQNFTIEPRIMWGENLMASRTSPARNSRPVERKNEETSTRGGSKTNVAVHSWKSSSRILLSLSLSLPSFWFSKFR